MSTDPIDLSKAPLPDVIAALASDPGKGLTAAEAEARLSTYGANALEEKKTSQLTVLLHFFWGPIPWMIEAAALMAAIVGDWGDFAIILALLLFNAALGFFRNARHRAHLPPSRIRWRSRPRHCAAAPGVKSRHGRSFPATSCASGWATWCRPTRG